MPVVLHHGDCLDIMRTLPDSSVDSIVTDPPYGLGFMGKAWDDLPPGEEWARECLRVLKPGGHLLAFGGSRTWHRLACAVEDAGFEVRDSIAWLYGSGFPKSLDVSKAIDKQDAVEARLARARRFQSWLREHVTPQQVNAATGTDMGHHYTTHPTQPSVATVAHLDMLRPLLPDVPEWVEEMARQRTVESAAFASREVVDRGYRVLRGDSTVPYTATNPEGHYDITAPATPDAERWQGWGTALKPAFEPVVVARKPLTGTVAQNVLTHGTGALNIDGCRIAGDVPSVPQPRIARDNYTVGGSDGRNGQMSSAPGGRWPANVILDEWHEPVLRLRYNLPSDIERTIRGFYGAGTDHLPAVPSVSDGAPEQGGASQVLLAPVPGAVDVGEPDRRECSTLGQAAHRGDHGADLGDEASEPATRPEGVQLEGRPVSESRLRLREAERAAGVRAGDVSLDGDAERRDLHPGAPARRGPESGQGAGVDGDRAPHQRREGGQSAGEPRAPRLEQLAPDEARRGRRGDVQAEAGERNPAARALEVLRCDVPPAWLIHFEDTGRAQRMGQADALDQQSGNRPSSGGAAFDRGGYGGTVGLNRTDRREIGYGDTGGASRFFYVAKAPKSERPRTDDGTAHPTVKPLALMRWLVRLVTPPGGVVLEPFAGSGTTVEACIIEGFDCIAIEREADYLPLIETRIERASA